MLLSSTLFVVIRMSQCSLSEPQMSVVPLSYPASVSLALCATYEFRDVALSRCGARQGRKKGSKKKGIYYLIIILDKKDDGGMLRKSFCWELSFWNL